MRSPRQPERKPRYRDDGVLHATINGHRLHLRRKDPTRDNFLWIDGRQPPIVLDRTAAEFVAHLIDAMWLHQRGDGDESRAVRDYVVDRMAERYSSKRAPWRRPVKRETILADLDRVFGTLMSVADGACPAEAGLDPKEIRYGEWSAPARMDAAITYRCNLECPKCYVGDRKTGRELDTAEWIKIYDVLWKAGVPQIVFTGGEPTLRDDLVELVGEADEFVTGLVTNGTKLAGLADALRGASLDYAQVTVESFDPKIHDRLTCTDGSHARTAAGIEKALSAGLQIITNTTLTRANAGTFVETLKWLRGLGVRNAACNTLICSGHGPAHIKENGLDDDSLRKTLDASCAAADEIGMTLQWYSPTCYNRGLNPVELGLGVKSCSAAAHNMTIQPDGTVIPCQSWPDSVGDILKDEWSSIWGHPACVKLRERGFAPDECRGCEYETVCGGGCPLDAGARTKRAAEGGKGR
ncbi:MAG: radical SAM protein [Candidatus Latescibacterota bacterium]|jgi:radical SAM protein with 4Fe4S-binding SPASM domain|nr:MAG: radical SAM protein [Candidatus Latescibacterota bacterium]